MFIHKGFDGALGVLAGRLLRCLRPLHLRELSSVIGQVEAFRKFQEIVEEFLPEHKAEIFKKPYIGNRIAAFARAFGEKHFPLPYHYEDNESEGYEELVYAVPICRMRPLSDDDFYDPTNLKPGLACMVLLNAYPWGMNDERIPWLDTLEPEIAALFRLIPEGGYTMEDVERACKNTPYQGLWDLARILSTTDDCPYFLYLPEDAETHDPWDRETIDELTGAWHESEEWLGRLYALAEDLGKDLHKNLRELIRFMNQKLERADPFIPPKEQLPLPLIEVFKEVKAA